MARLVREHGGPWSAVGYVLSATDPQTADDFFRSVRAAFRRNEEHAGTVGYSILALGLALLGFAQIRPLLRKQAAHRAARAAFRRLVAEQALSRDDVDLLMALAGHAGTRPLVVATHIDVFERASAAELRGRPASLVIHDGDIHSRLRLLRQRLGFGALSAHEPLLTTRELMKGTSVELLGEKCAVDGVTEAYFSVVARERPPVDVGVKVPLTAHHGREATYSVACPLLAVEPVDAAFAVFFAHDEAPARRQQRQFVRVAASIPIELRVEMSDARPDASARPHRGTLVDLSLNGAAVSLTERLAVRARVRAAFSFRDEAFRDLVAGVLECEGAPDGPYRVRIEFRDLSREDERRLSAVMARATARQRAPSRDTHD